MKEYIKINEQDNVVVALRDFKEGDRIQAGTIDLIVKEAIPSGHKIALQFITEGEKVIKYGNPIGLAKADIEAGTWVHTHNIKTGLGEICSYVYEKDYKELESTEDAYFRGYRRKDGKVGIRNEIWIIPTVGCVNKIAALLERKGNSMLSDNVEKVCAFEHPYGCSQMGEDQENTKKILAGLVNHPNAGGVLVLGLGCENSGVEQLKEHIGKYDENRVKFLICQEEEDEVEAALKLLSGLIEYASTFAREEIHVKELIIGLKCGGSDGFSGITANPLVGAFSDILISKGGTTILTEVPEMFGAETLLMSRCREEGTFDKTVAMINGFKDYYTSHNQTIYENPSPGNKQGGISTLEDKSLGCTQKSGNAPVSDVLPYGSPVKSKGLNLLTAPGNDLVAATALAASGAHIVLFTTGRGTPFACPVPTVKISSNSKLYERKRNWIDFNAGVLLEDGKMDNIAQNLFSFVLDTASGKTVKSEIEGFHDMAVWKDGVTL